MATTTKTQQVVKMTTLGIEQNLGHMDIKRWNFKLSLRNPIKFTDSLKVTAGHLLRNNGKKDVRTLTPSSSQNDYLGHSSVKLKSKNRICLR